jgi:hypothetical protein
MVQTGQISFRLALNTEAGLEGELASIITITNVYTLAWLLFYRQHLLCIFRQGNRIGKLIV